MCQDQMIKHRELHDNAIVLLLYLILHVFNSSMKNNRAIDVS